MESCETIWDWMSLAVDGEASQAQELAISCHIADCAQCARDFAFLKSTSETLVSTPLVDPPVTLRQSILAATLDKPTFVDRFRRALGVGLSPARYALVAAAGAIAAFLLFNDNSQDKLWNDTTRSQVAAVSPKSENQDRRNEGPLAIDQGSELQLPTLPMGTQQPDMMARLSGGGFPASIPTQAPVIKLANLKAIGSPVKRSAPPGLAPMSMGGAPENRNKVASPMMDESVAFEPDMPNDMMRTAEFKPEQGDISPTMPETSVSSIPMETAKSYKIVLTASSAVVSSARPLGLASIAGDQGDVATKFRLPESGRQKTIKLDFVKGSF